MPFIFKCDNCGTVDETTTDAHGFIMLHEVGSPPGGARQRFLCAFCYRAVRDAVERAFDVAASQHPSQP